MIVDKDEGDFCRYEPARPNPHRKSRKGAQLLPIRLYSQEAADRKKGRRSVGIPTRGAPAYDTGGQINPLDACGAAENE